MERLSPHLLHRDDTVLVVIDVQERLARVMPERDAVVRAIGLLVRSAVALDIPVIATRQNPAGLGDVVPELARALSAGETVIDKVTFCCLAEPAFAAALAASGRQQVALAGMETHICIAQTALALMAAGYSTHVVADAVCSRREADRASALVRLGSAGAELTTAESVVYELLGRSGTDEFRTVLGYVKDRDAAS